MAARVCPKCLKAVPATSVAAFSDGFLCPHCQAPLEVTEYSRMPAVVVGLLAAWLVWRVTNGAEGALGAVLPELYAILAFAIITPLVLMFIADLRLAPPSPPPGVPAPPGVPEDDHAQAGSHH